MQDKIEKLPLNKRFVPVRDLFIDLPDRQQVAFYHQKATRTRVNGTLRALVLVAFSRFILANKSIKKELTKGNKTFPQRRQNQSCERNLIIGVFPSANYFQTTMHHILLNVIVEKERNVSKVIICINVKHVGKNIPYLTAITF